MTFVVTENCDKCRFTDCISVCPVDCFYGDDSMLYIHPDECIDCGACEPECPVEAIFDDSNLSEDMEKWIQINKERSEMLPNITEKLEPLPTAKAKKAKLGF